MAHVGQVFSLAKPKLGPEGVGFPHPYDHVEFGPKHRKCSNNTGPPGAPAG